MAVLLGHAEGLLGDMEVASPRLDAHGPCSGWDAGVPLLLLLLLLLLLAPGHLLLPLLYIGAASRSHLRMLCDACCVTCYG